MSDGHTLEELIALWADSAETNWVELHRNDFAAHGAPAVAALEPWLLDELRGPRAVAVMVRAGKFNDAYAPAVRSLRSARSNSDASANWRYIEDGLRSLGEPWTPSKSHHGWTQPRPPQGQPWSPLPKGVLVAPAVDPLHNKIHHIIAAHAVGLEVYGGEAYLFYCGRAFTGGWVRHRGGALEAGDLPICDNCRKRMAEGRR